MPRMSVSWILATVLLLVGFSQIADARDTREHDLPEKVEGSDEIFVGTVIALSSPDPRINGVAEYAVVRVDKALKGGGIGHEKKFVIKGFSAELNPDCCQIGKSYLFFARNGYEVFVMGAREFSMARIHEGDFLSAVNGRFSTYLIDEGSIIGWRGSLESDRIDTPKEDVLKDLCRLIGGRQ